LSGDGSPRTEYVSRCRTLGARSYMMRRDDWKYVYTEADGFEELYDLARDPHERTNLAARTEHDAVRETLRAALVAWAVRTGDPCVRGERLPHIDAAEVKPSSERFEYLGLRRH